MMDEQQHSDDLDRATESPGNGGRRLSRRQFLRAAAWSSVGLIGSQFVALEGARAAALLDIVLPPGQQPSYVTTLHRRDDLLDLRFEFYNLMRFASITTGESWLQRVSPNQPAYVVVVFPPQAIAEYAFKGKPEPQEDLHAPLSPDSPQEWASAGESRLAFEVPSEIETIPYTTESLLSWTAFEPRLVPAALPAGAAPFPYPQVREPHAHETSIELPWRLMLSPHAGLGWAHATGLVTHNGRTEIWHTRLGVRKGNLIDEWDTDGRTARAIWTPDRPITHPFDPFKTSLTAHDRRRIVEATSDATAVAGLPVPVQVNRMMLTPLGGWLDVVGSWENHVSLEAWRHLATMGRDHYVRVIEKGFLFPFGHAASRLKITERRFEELNGQPGGFLRQEIFIVVRQPTKHYTAPDQPHGAPGQPDEGRAWPLRTVQFTTLITPAIDPTSQTDPALVTVAGEPYPFHATAKDLEGRDIDFVTPVYFVPAEAAFGGPKLDALITEYKNLNPASIVRRRELSGQKVALAEPKAPGDTTLELQTLVLGAEAADGISEDDLKAHEQPAFYPSVAEFSVRLSAVAQTSANGDLPAQRFTLGPYVPHGFKDGPNENPGGVFAELELPVGESPPGVEFDADSSGGLATPDFEPRAISRELGAVGGKPEDIQKGTFDPKDIFKESAKLLGGIKLSDIIKKVENFHTNGGAMKITTRPIHDDPAGPPVKIVTELEWEPGLQPDPLKLFEPDPGSLRIEAEFVQDLDQPDQSTYDIEGDLRDFKMNLVGTGSAKFMILTFNRLHFRARSGQKTDLKPLIKDVAFAGPLEFVNRIKDFLTFGGSGPSISVDGTGLTAAYDLPLPQIPIGALMINDVAMAASLFLPWREEALIRFGLSSREKPFNVTYSAIGGGGYFGITFGISGLKKFECALELGAYLSLDFGVVSGSVSVSAGIHFEIEMVPDDTDPSNELASVGLTAYFRFVGKVEALGIVTVSLELYLGLKFQTNPTRLTGTAKAELKIKVLIFEGSVKVTVKRTISATSSNLASAALTDATPNGPTFAALFDEQHWVEYAEAFA